MSDTETNMNLNVDNSTGILRSKKKQRLVMFYDTETVGSLIKMFDKFPYPPLEDQPHLIQVSYALFDEISYEVKDFYCAYIKIDDMSLINDESFEFNHIRRETCEQYGRPILEVLQRFYSAYIQAERVCAHNIRFDRKIMLFEIQRNKEELFAWHPDSVNMFKYYENIEDNPVQPYCTMNNSQDMCQVPHKDDRIRYYRQGPRQGQIYYKAPKLIELYRFLFREEPPEPLHNAVIDTLVGLRCYMRINNKTIHIVKFNHMIKNGFQIAQLDPALLDLNLRSLA